jgi:hypothetical protein
LSIWLANADVARRHLSQDLPLVFQVSTAAGKEVSLSVRAEPLVLSAETPPKLGYGSAQDEGSTSFQSRTLSWLRVGLGLTYTQLRDRSYRIGPNEIGAPVIQSTDSASLAPVLYFTHYWNAADTRDPGTPWNSRIPGWERNLLPTLTVGIPLSRSPLENVFLGATIQLVPGIAFSGGVHIGRVTRLRSGFSVDTAPPADPAFRIQDATEPRLAIAPYLAVIVTDTLFVGAIQKLAN